MFSKKTRNLTVAVLALVMALTLSFGLFGFNTQVDAATANITKTASWDIKEVDNDKKWTAVYTDKVLKSTNDITIKAGADSTAEAKGNAADNTIKASKGKKEILTVTVPGQFNGTLTISASSFSNTKETSLSLDGGTGKTVSKLTASGDANDIEKLGAIGDDAIIKAQHEVSFELKNTATSAKTFSITNSHSKNSAYISSVVVTGTVPVEVKEGTTLALDNLKPSYTAYVGEPFDTSDLPTKGTLSNANNETTSVTVNWTLTSGDTTANGNTLVYTAEVVTPSDWALASTFKAPTINVSVIGDTRPMLETLTGYTAIVKANELKFPTTLKGTLSDGSETQINVEFKDQTLNTAAPSETTYTATAVAGDIYQLPDTAVTAEVTLKVKPVYDFVYKAYAYWDIKEVKDGTNWTDTYKDRVIINNVNGITVKASGDAEADPKQNSVENCIKTRTDNAFFTVTVPAKFNGSLTVLASAYKEGAHATLAFNGDSTNAELTKGTNVETLATDDAIMGAQTSVTFNFVNTDSQPKSFTLSNTGANGYISSIKVEGTAVDTSAQSAKQYFFAGETLGTMEVAGYQFLGWTNGTEILKVNTPVTVAGDYTAICAKLAFVGGSIRTTGTTGVRYMFELELYNVTDAAVMDYVASTISGNFNLQTSQANGMDIAGYKVNGNKIAMNAVVVNALDATANEADKALCTTNIVATINVTVAGTSMNLTADGISMAYIAEVALGRNEIDLTLAQKYGYVAQA